MTSRSELKQQQELAIKRQAMYIVTKLKQREYTPNCGFCLSKATVKLGDMFCCDLHGKKYGGFNTDYARSLRGE